MVQRFAPIMNPGGAVVSLTYLASEKIIPGEPLRCWGSGWKLDAPLQGTSLVHIFTVQDSSLVHKLLFGFPGPASGEATAVTSAGG